MITIRKRHFAMPLAAALAAAALSTVAAGSASAATVRDGTDPNNTGCASSASTILSVQDPTGTGGLLELRWSSHCETAWARFTCQQDPNGFGCTNYKIYIRRDNDGANYSVTVHFPTITPVNHQLYTLQLNDGGGQSAKACFYDLNTSVTACTGSF
jgi:Protein of unknown function (DUF2690)